VILNLPELSQNCFYRTDVNQEPKDVDSA